MNDNEWKKFGNALIKQGNSFCLRVPSTIVKELDAKSGDFLDIRVRLLPMDASEKNITPIYKKFRKLKELRSYEDEELMIMSIIYFNEGKQYMGTEIAAVIGGEEPKDVEKLKKKTTQMIESYNKKVLNNYGEKIHNRYLKFKDIVNEQVKKHNGLNW